MKFPGTFIRSASTQEIEDATLAVCVVERKEIERGLTGDVVDRLMRLTDEDATAERLDASLVLVIDGYDGDPRSIYAIPEVCRFMRDITSMWPFWFHFLERDTPALPGLMCILVDHHVLSGDHASARLSIDDAMLQRVGSELLEAMRAMHARLDYPLERAAAAEQEVITLLAEHGLKLRLQTS